MISQASVMRDFWVGVSDEACGFAVVGVCLICLLLLTLEALASRADRRRAIMAVGWMRWRRSKTVFCSNSSVSK